MIVYKVHISREKKLIWDILGLITFTQHYASTVTHTEQKFKKITISGLYSLVSSRWEFHIAKIRFLNSVFFSFKIISVGTFNFIIFWFSKDLVHYLTRKSTFTVCSIVREHFKRKKIRSFHFHLRSSELERVFTPKNLYW